MKVVQFNTTDHDSKVVECVHPPGRSMARQSYSFNHGLELAQVDSVVPRCTRNMWYGGKSRVCEQVVPSLNLLLSELYAEQTGKDSKSDEN